MTDIVPEQDLSIHSGLREALEQHVIMESLRETKASPDVVRIAAHVLVDIALDQQRQVRMDEITSVISTTEAT